jgi:predicted metal-binding membrane protein
MLALAAAALAAWTVMAASAAAQHVGQPAGAHGMTGMAHMPGMAATGMAAMSETAAAPAGDRHASMLLGAGAVGGIAMWTLMVVAMMLPSALPAVSHVAGNSLRWRRRRAMATFVAVYLSIWLAFGALVLAAAPVWSGVKGARGLAGALALAALWQVTAQKRRALRDCHRPSPLPPRGRRATAGVVRFALMNGFACVRSCWAMMLATAVATSATTLCMVAVAGIVTAEKLAQRPRRATRASAVVLAAGAAAAAASTLVA